MSRSKIYILAAIIMLAAVPMTLSMTGYSITFPWEKKKQPVKKDERVYNIKWKHLRELNYKTGIAGDGIKIMNGKLVKIPGYIVPLDFESEKVTEFLLVPTMGACIHVPPPPPNQTVYVTSKTPIPAEEIMYRPFWVSGRLKISSHTSELAEAGFHLESIKVDPYKFEARKTPETPKVVQHPNQP